MTIEFKERILAASANKTPLCIQGGASKQWYGQQPQGAVLDTRSHSGIVDYDPTELVITARCGTPLAEINRVLAEQHQCLAFEPPSFSAHATIGGTVAAGLSGPRRAYAGAMRDFVLGIVLMDGQGERLNFGGQVMKNVAGYDVSRMLTGSMGCLGLLLELSIKVLPIPGSEVSLAFAMTQEQALTQLNHWAGMPLPISASSWDDGQLRLRLSGSLAATADAQRQLGGELIDADSAAQYWLSLREQQHAFFNQSTQQAGLWRLSLPSTAPAIDLGGSQLIEWGGAQRWLTGSILESNALRQRVAALGGHATLFKGGDKGGGVFQPLAGPLMAIHRRLKNSFDPAGIFNPGRLYSDL